MQLTLLGRRRLPLKMGLAFVCATAALSLAPAASQAAFTLAPCHGSATAGRGATFPALLHNSGFWGAGFDSSAGCGNVAGAPKHPTYNSATLDSVGTAAGASPTGSGGGVGACGGGAGGWPVGYRDTTVRFCATDDPVTPTQLVNIDAGAYNNGTTTIHVPGLIHQLPWASGAVTVAIHLPEGCLLPAPGTSGQATSPTTGWTNTVGVMTDPSGDTAATNTTRPYITDSALEKALAGDPSEQFWGQLVPNMTGTPATAADGDSQDTGLSCAGTSSATHGIPIIRIVRSDNSGTSFNFKSFLGLVKNGLGNDTSNTNSWTGPTSTTGGSALGATHSGGANTDWPTSDSFTSPFDAGATGHQTDANNICEWNTTVFPSANSDVSSDHICGGHKTGAGNVALGVLATNGSIGYVDVATARNTKLTGVPAPQQDFQDYQTSSGTRDDTFWIPVQNCPDQAVGCTQTYAEPTSDPTNHQATGGGSVGTQGANCTNLPNLKNVPTAASSPQGDATLGDWSKTVAVGGSGYPICILTYGLIWDDNSKVYGNSASEQAQARTVLDYVDFIASADGQSFVNTDFSAPPLSIQNIMRTGTADGTGNGGIAAIDWNKTACTSNCTTSSTTTSTTTTTRSTTTGPPPPPPNQFTISGSHVKNHNVVFTVKVPFHGHLKVAAVIRFHNHNVVFATSNNVVGAGTGTITLRPGSKAKGDIAATLNTKRLTVTVSITFTPTGGHARTKTVVLHIKGTKKPPTHKHKKH
jgi:hypothetical protein